MKVGDFIRYEHSGGSWTGWILKIEKESLYGHEVATIWRPTHPISVMTWPLTAASIEVLNESR